MTDTSWIRRQRWADRDKYALPFNLELNVKDVRRIWDWEGGPMSTVVALNLMRPARASIKYETHIESLGVLLRELTFALRAMDRDLALKEVQFDRRWSRLESECLLLRAVPGQNAGRLRELDFEYKEVTTSIRLLLDDWPPSPEPPQSKAGAKPKYDWHAAEQHIRGLFDHHGPLSPDDPQWSHQADVERALAAFFQSNSKKEPSESVLRQRAREFIASVKAGN